MNNSFHLQYKERFRLLLNFVLRYISYARACLSYFCSQGTVTVQIEIPDKENKDIPGNTIKNNASKSY